MLPPGWSRDIFNVPGTTSDCTTPPSGGDIAVGIRAKCDVSSDDATALKVIDHWSRELGADFLSITPAVGWIARGLGYSGSARVIRADRCRAVDRSSGPLGVTVPMFRRPLSKPQVGGTADTADLSRLCFEPPVTR